MSFLDISGRSLANVGIYTLPQAARLVRLPPQTVEKMVGDVPTERTSARTFPIAIAEIDLGFGERVITFQGLMELWVAAALRMAGIEWPAIRLAAYQASRILNTKQPLSTGAFRTERRRVFLSLRANRGGAKTAVDLLDRQQVFEDVIERSLSPLIAVRDSDGRISRFYPRGLKRQVVLDPGRRFGEPIDPESGVPTKTLAEAYLAESRSLAAVTRWFDVSKKAVRDAVEFEQWLNQE